MRRQCGVEHFAGKFGGIVSKHGIFATLLHHPDNTFLPKNLPHWRADTIRPYELNRRERSEHYAPGTMRYVCVGEDSIFPVVSPLGKQRRRNAPTMHHRTFVNENRRYHAETWYICNIGTPVRPIRFCPKICNVGGRILSVILWCDRPRRSLDFDSLRVAPHPRTPRNIRSVIRWHRLRRASLPSWAARFHCYFLLYIEDNPPAKSCCGLRRIFAGGSGADITKNLFPKKEVLVGEDGFEPSKRNAADLQSVPFGHSGTPPYSIRSDFGTDWSR